MKTIVFFILLYCFLPLTNVYAREGDEIVEKIRTRDCRMHDFIITYDVYFSYYSPFDDINDATAYINSKNHQRPVNIKNRAVFLSSDFDTIQERNILYKNNNFYMDFNLSNTGFNSIRLYKNNMKYMYNVDHNAINIEEGFDYIINLFEDIHVLNDKNYELNEITIRNDDFHLTLLSADSYSVMIDCNRYYDFAPSKIMMAHETSRKEYIFGKYIKNANFCFPKEAYVKFYKNHPAKDALYLSTKMIYKLKNYSTYDNLDESRLSFMAPVGTDVSYDNKTLALFDKSKRIINFDTWASKYIKEWR